MKSLQINLALLAVFTISFLLLGGLEKTGDVRLGIGLVTLVPLIVAAYILNNIAKTRTFAVFMTTLAIFFGIVAPVGYCMLAVAGVILFLAVVFTYDYLMGRTYLGAGPDRPLPQAGLGILAKFAAIAIYAAWLVHQIF